MSSHVLSLLVENKPGLLTRVAGLFARRGFNIESLVVEVTGDKGKVEAFLRALEPFGVKELAQSGLLAIGRGGKSITERVLRG